MDQALSDHDLSTPSRNIEPLPESQQNISFSLLQPFWNYYFTTSTPQTLSLDLPLHKIIFAFNQATAKPFFTKVFQIQDYERHFYEVTLDFEVFPKILRQQNDELAEVLLEVLSNFQGQAAPIIPAISLVLHGFISQIQKKRSKKVYLVIENYPESNINDIKSNMIDNFIRFEAVILKVYQSKLMALSLEFQCSNCRGIFIHYLSDGHYSLPTKCKAGKKECISKYFTPKKQSVKTTFIQRIKVQEIDSEDRTPKQTVCQLRENFVGKVITGQTVKLTGLLKTQVSEMQRDKKTQGIFIPFLLVNSITQKTNIDSIQYNMNLIIQMRSNPNIFYSLLKSFCPTIYGHQIVKAGLLLGIIGGSAKNLSDESTFRETSHILLLGDPGLGKSQLMKFAVEILPHSIYISATGISTSGLTVTVNRDQNEQSLEAGALILADNGVCAIDQFDKTSESSALLEAMEQQTISIAKAGIICQLKCRVGIIASANPTSGCYNRAKSFKDNTKISNAILSRFDLIFLLVDKPDPQRDKKLAEHIMKIHNNKRKRKLDSQGVATNSHSINIYEESISLADKYHKICQVEQKTYTLEQIKKYMTYVKQEIHPTLSRQASEVIKGFYLILRESCPSNAFQITNRQLESMVRLAMARARIQCRTVVTEADAIEVTHLMQESLFDSFEEMGYNTTSVKYQAKRAKIPKKNSELSLPKQRTLYINHLREVSEEEGKQIWQWNQLIKAAKELDLSIGDFYSFIERLNQDGVLLQKGNKRYAFKGTYI